MLKYELKQVVSVQDWDALVESTYGRPYSFQQQDGCKARQTVDIIIPEEAYDYENDTIPEEVNGEDMGVSFAAWLARDPAQKLDTEDDWDRERGLSLFWGRNFYPDVQMVANDLHAKGLIEAGEYSIVIDW